MIERDSEQCPLSYGATGLVPTGVNLLTRNDSAADPLVKDLVTTPGKSSFMNVQRVIRLTPHPLPLKREDGAG